MTFRGWPETTVEEADKTITLRIPTTTDDDDDERHGSITLRVLPPETIDVDEPSSYEVGVDEQHTPFETATVRVNDNDYDPPLISISDARAGEADGRMDFFVTVAPSEREMSVNWNTVTETGVGVATETVDYAAASGILTFAVGETTKTITVEVLDDNQAETDETFQAALSGPNDASLGKNSGTGTIEDDDEGTVVTIHPQGPYGGTEEGQPAEFVLQRAGGSEALQVTLNIGLEGDFTAFTSSSFPTNVTIPAGKTEFLLQIMTIDDDKVEANGSVTATVQPGNGYSPGIPDTARVIVRDNDRTLSISDAEAGEGAGSMTFTLTLSEAAEKPVRVEVLTSDGKATSRSDVTETSLGKDFEAKSEVLVFEPGETQKSFTVTLVDDNIDESAEAFTVRLFSPSSNVWLTEASATGTISDNDDPMEAQISRQVKRLDENQTGPVVFAVELTHSTTAASERDTKLYWEVKPGEATEEEDYAKPYSQQRGTLDIPIGHLTAAIEVDLIDDDLLEQELETFTVELVEGRRLELSDNEGHRKVRISIRDDERLSAAITPRSDSVSEGDDAVFEVRLSDGVTMEPTVLEYAVAGTADSGDDYTAPSGTLTIPAGRDAGTITIPVLEDSTLDPAETLEVTLTSGKSGSRDARIPVPTAAVTILETGTMTVSVASAEAEEGGTLSFAVTFSLASQEDVAVDWRTADDPEAVAAATADVDYVATSATLTVPAGLTSAVITVQTNEDTLAAEGDETFRVNLIRARSVSPSVLDDLPLGLSSAVGTIWDNDIAPTGMTLTATPDRVGEDAGATPLTVTATLGGQRSLARDTRVQLALEDGAAAADDDYEAATARLTIPAGQMSATATLTLTPVDDSVWEGDETVSIAGTAGDLEVTPAEVTITDDDAAPTGVTLTLAPAVIGEAAGETDLTVTAMLTGGDSLIADTEIALSVEGVSLTLNNDDGTTTATTAATGDDFSYAAATLTIPAGQIGGSATLTFTPVDDTVVEDDETAQVSGTAEGLTVTAAGLTIEDNDQEPTRIALSVTPAEVSEGNGATTLTVTATLEGGGSRISATDVSLTVEGVTATAGDDFTAQGGVTLTIPAGRLSHTADLTLTPVDDNLAEGNEEVSIGGSNAEPGLPVVGVQVDLTDNDYEPTKITLSLNKNYVEENRGSQWLTVTGAVDGNSRRTVDTFVRLRVASGTATTADYWALAGDLVIEAGEREGAADIVLVPADDHIDEDDETLEVWGSTTRFRSAAQLQVSRQQITIRDDDTAGVTVTPTELSVVEGQDNSYRVVLDSQPTGDVTVAIAGHADTDITLSGATLSNDALTFTAGNWNIAQEVTVTAVQDDDATASPDVTLTHTVSGGDYGDVTAADVVVSITEDDVPGVTLTPDTVDIDEGGSGTYTVVLDSQPTASVTVAITGHADTDITLSGATLRNDALTFTSDNWNTAQTVTVTAAEDDDAVDEEEATLAHSASGGGYDEVTADDVTVTITDDDTAGVTISETELSIDEGATAIYTVVLDSQPSATVTVAIAGHADTDITLSGVTLSNDALTFTSDNWDTVQTVTVTAAEDDDAVDEEEATLAHSASGGGYDEVTAGSVTVTITDDDTVGVTISETALSIDEGGSGSYTVKLDTEPTGDVTVAIAGHADTDITLLGVTLSNDALTFTPDNWNTVQTVTVTAAEDDDAVDEEEATLAHSASGGGYDEVTAGSVTVTITDDDTAGVTISETALSIDEGGSGSYTVKLDTEPTGDVTVAIAGHADTDITLSGVTLSNDALTFTSDNWDTVQTVTVTAAEDDDAVDEEEATLAHSASGGGYDEVTADDVTVTITDDDTAGVTISETELSIDEGATAIYTVKLDSQPSASVTVAIAGHADTDITLTGDTLTNDALTFTAENWSTAQTVTVTAAQDDDATADGEITLTHTVAGGDYEGLIAADVVVTIDEQDSPGVTVSESELTIDEGASDTYTVVLDTQPTGDVTVAIAGHADTDITVSGATLTDDAMTFTPDNWNTAQTVTVTAAEDDDAVNGAEATLTHAVSGGGYDEVTVGSVTVTITENDTVGVTISETALSIDEGGSAAYTVVLNTEPTASVTVVITGHADTDITLSGATLSNDSLTFTSDNWDTAQTVTVTAGEDDDAVDEEATLAHSASGGGYDEVTADDVTVTITDNDSASPSLDLSLPVPTYIDVDGSGTITLNDVLTYTATATNDGNVRLSGVTLSDLLVDKDGHDCGSLDIGEQCQLTGTHTVTQTDVDAGVVTNTVTAEADEVTTPVTVSQRTDVAQERALALTKTTTTTGFAAVGEQIAYTYTVSNSGTVTLSGTLAISDDKMATTDITCGAVPDGGLVPSASVTCSGTYTVVQADLDADGVTNKASTSLDEVTSNEAMATVPWVAPQEDTEPQVSIGLAVQVAENVGTAKVAVTLSKSSLQTVTVDYVTSDGTATSGTDYVAASATLTFAPGETDKEIQVQITDDVVDEEEEDETFTVTLSNPNNASLGASASTVTITDNDDPAVTVGFGQTAYSVGEGGTVEVTVTLSADPEREVTILLTHDPQGGASSDDYSDVPESLVFRSGDTEKSFTFSATGDDIDDDGESVALAFETLPAGVTAGTTATVSIDDDDMAGVTVSATSLSIDEGGSATYTVALDTEPTEDVTVAIAGHGDTDITLSGATLSNDALTFTASDWNTVQTVTVSAAQDSDAVSDAAVTLTHTVTGTGEYAGVTAGSVTVTIVEKDASVLSVSDARAAEDGGNVVFIVSISAANGEAVTVDYATSDGTATAGADYTETTGTLTFPANSVAGRTVSVPVTNDTEDEAEEETFTLTLSNVQGASLAGGDSTLDATGTITDNDAPTVTASFGQTAYSVDEGGTVQVTVTLSADPEREVTIPADPRSLWRNLRRRLLRRPGEPGVPERRYGEALHLQSGW